MQKRKSILGYVEYRQELLQMRFGELKQHLALFNKARKKYKKSPFKYWFFGFVPEGNQLLEEIQHVRKEMRVLKHSQSQLEAGHDIHLVIQNVNVELPNSRTTRTGLELAFKGLI